MPFLRGAILRRQSQEVASKKIATNDAIIQSGKNLEGSPNSFNEIYDARADADKGQFFIKGLEQPIIGNPNKDKGNLYECYVASLYKEKGYTVDYNGQKKNGHDMGIDLLCYYKDFYTVCVQCKCYEVSKLSINDIFKFYGAFKYHASQHLDRTVSGAFWTAQTISVEADIFQVTKRLGIELFSGVSLPMDFHI